MPGAQHETDCTEVCPVPHAPSTVHAYPSELQIHGRRQLERHVEEAERPAPRQLSLIVDGRREPCACPVTWRDLGVVGLAVHECVANTCAREPPGEMRILHNGTYGNVSVKIFSPKRKCEANTL